MRKKIPNIQPAVLVLSTSKTFLHRVCLQTDPKWLF